MTDIIKPEALITFGVVLLPIGIGVAAKIVSLNKVDKHKILNELSIGVDLIVTAMVLIITRPTDRFTILNKPVVEKAISQGLAVEVDDLGMLWFILALLITSGSVRIFGWRNKNDLHGLWGVLLPNVIGFLLLWYVVENY